jgi:hypothetical protein
MSALTTPTWSNTREINKKRNKRKETSTSDRRPKIGEEQDQLKKTSLVPLRQGPRLDTSETKPCSNKERKPPNQSSNTTKSSPCTYASSPWAKTHYTWTNAAMSKNLLNMHRAIRPPTRQLDRQHLIWPPGGRLDRPKRPALHQTAQNLPEPIGTPYKHS